MAKWKLLLEESDVRALEMLVRDCKKEFIRDKRAGREPLNNELNLLSCLSILGMKGWVLGDYNKSKGEENK